MAESIKISIDLPVSPERAYRAWLDSYEHSQFTGSAARIDATAGGKYTALDGAVAGQTMVMTPFSHIVQTWHSADFPSGSTPSQIDIKLEATCLGSQLTLNQTGIPDGHSRQVMDVWENQYFRPMIAYFEALVGDYTADMDG